jgi:hypothetical protein
MKLVQPYREEFKYPAQVRRLASAILAMAVTDYRGGEDGFIERRKKSRASLDIQREDAFKWITQEPSEWFFSFYGVCHILDLSPEWVRYQILSGKAKAVRKSKLRR